MENLNNRALQLELKYCERCGGLWLRPRGSELIFCAGCAEAMAGLIPLWPRTPQTSEVRRKYCLRTQKSFWGEGGNA
jgi:Zn-finger nucleic acid-binding protein